MDKMTVWNMALGWVGTSTVASESENTPAAIQCGIYWDSARRQSLRDYPWNVAQRRVWLAEIPMLEGWEKEYSHAYALPDDCLKASKLMADGHKETRFGIGYNPATASRALLANADRALLLYTADIGDACLADDLFAAVLSRKLATMIAVPLLRNNSQKVQELEQLYRAAIPNALEADAGEGADAERPDSWIQSRAWNGGCAS